MAGITCAAGFAQAEALSRLLEKTDSALYGSDSDVDLADRWRIVGELTLCGDPAHHFIL